jgi:hypothetical protein
MATPPTPHASVSARRPHRTLIAWGLLVLPSLALAPTSLHSLTATSQVAGATPSSRAEALHVRAAGGDAGQRPTDVIVVRDMIGESQPAET